MPEPKTSLDVYMQRMDVLCSVIEKSLEPGSRATKRDLRMLWIAAQKVIHSYEEERKDAVASR